MAVVSLTLGEAKTNVSLSLETKDSGLTWDTIGGTWDDANSTWDTAKATLTREAKTNVSLTLETK